MRTSVMKTAMLTGSALLTVWSGNAFAAGTTSGTSINNTASVTYAVGGSTTTVNSNTATFVVDKKVNLTVVAVGSPTTTSIGSSDQVTTFRVTNLTNDVQDFHLTPEQLSISVPVLGSDNFDVTNMRAYVDANGNGQYDAGVDTATYIDELGADSSVIVFIVANIPNQQGAATAIVDLAATAAAGGQAGTKGAVLTATSLLQADSSATVDIVFADALGTGDLARDGLARAFNAYVISTANVSMGKTAKVISDPYNLLVNPKAIPGATVEYCLALSNAGPGTASNLAVADAIPAGTTFVANSINVGTVGVAGACILLGTNEDDDQVGADETDLYGGYFDGTNIHASIPSLTTSVPLNVSFQVTIN